jgi:hypothetical protein
MRALYLSPLLDSAVPCRLRQQTAEHLFEHRRTSYLVAQNDVFFVERVFKFPDLRGKKIKSTQLPLVRHPLKASEFFANS